MLKSNSLDKPAPSSLRPVLVGASRTITTYEDVWKFKPRHVVESASVDDIRSAVAEAAASGLRVRAIGAGSSWASHLVTRDVCVSLRKLSKIHNIDLINKTVTVDAGVRLGDLSRALASGEVRKFGPDSQPEELRAARVAIGMLGVIVRLELQAVDLPWVRFSELTMNLETFPARLPAILSQYEHVWAHWTLGEDTVRVECLEARKEKTDGFHRYNAIWRPASRVLVQLLNRCGISTSSLLQLRDRFYWFMKSARRRGASSSLKPDGVHGKVFMSMQYGVPASQMEMAVDRIRNSNFAAQNRGRVVEFKFLKGKDLSYLGPNCDGDAVLFNLWWLVDEPNKLDVFDSFEETMQSIHARPHWGKFHRPPSREYMQATYPRWAEFEAVRSRFDPGGMFSIFDRDDAR